MQYHRKSSQKVYRSNRICLLLFSSIPILFYSAMQICVMYNKWKMVVKSQVVIDLFMYTYIFLPIIIIRVSTRDNNTAVSVYLTAPCIVTWSWCLHSCCCRGWWPWGAWWRGTCARSSGRRCCNDIYILILLLITITIGDLQPLLPSHHHRHCRRGGGAGQWGGLSG